MNRAEKIALLKRIQDGDTEAVELLKPVLTAMIKGEIYEIEGKPFTEAEFNKMRANYGVCICINIIDKC